MEQQAEQLLEGLVITKPEELVIHHDAHPLAIDRLLTSEFGHIWYTWEPETIRREIELTFGYQPSELCRAKIQAIKTLVMNKAFWTVWEVFAPTALALNNVLSSPAWLTKPTPAQCYVAVDISRQVDKFPFSKEVTKFIAGVNLDDGIIFAIEPLKFIQRELERPMYRCLDCGFTSPDDGNRICDYCYSKNIERFTKHSLSPTEKRRLAQLLSREQDPVSEEDVVDVLAAKLRVIDEYMKFRRAQLSEQMKLLEEHGR